MQLTIDKEGKRRISLTKPERHKLRSAVPVLHSLEQVSPDGRIRVAAQTLSDVVTELDTTGDVAVVEQTSQPTAKHQANGNGEEIDFSIRTGTVEEMLGLYVKLEQKRRRLEDDLKETKLRQSAVAEPLVERMAAEGMQRINKDGLTVYLRQQRFVNKKTEVSMDIACRMLESWGLGYMVNDAYNATSLKSKIIEMLDQEEELPKGFDQYFNVHEQTVLGCQKAD